MKCPTAEEIGLCVTGDLEEEDRSRVEAHIEECRSCREAVEGLRRAGDALRREVPSLSDADWERFERRLLERFRRGEAEPKRGSRLVRLALDAAAVAALVLLSVGAWTLLAVREPAREAPGGMLLLPARLRTVRGGVSIVRGRDRLAAGAVTDLREGDRVETEQGALASILYDDGTAVDLNGRTRVKLGGGRGKLLDLAHGDIFAEVSRQPEGRPMVLVSPAARIEVLGTVLELSTAEGRDVLRMAEGSARLESEEWSAVVSAGEEVATSPGGAVKGPIHIGLEKVAPWRRAGGGAELIRQDSFESDELDPFWRLRKPATHPAGRWEVGNGALVLRARESEHVKLRSRPVNLARGPVEIEVETDISAENTEARAWIDVVLHRDISYSVCLARVRGGKARLVVSDDGRFAVGGGAELDKGLKSSVRRPVGRVTVNLYLGARPPFFDGPDAEPARRAEWKIRRITIRRLSGWPASFE
jgi:ferric-dicitrate binding protein FerR (iron transport regulator)